MSQRFRSIVRNGAAAALLTGVMVAGSHNLGAASWTNPGPTGTDFGTITFTGYVGTDATLDVVASTDPSTTGVVTAAGTTLTGAAVDTMVLGAVNSTCAGTLNGDCYAHLAASALCPTPANACAQYVATLEATMMVPSTISANSGLAIYVTGASTWPANRFMLETCAGTGAGGACGYDWSAGIGTTTIGLVAAPTTLLASAVSGATRVVKHQIGLVVQAGDTTGNQTGGITYRLTP